jgi:hypothetical protein
VHVFLPDGLHTLHVTRDERAGSGIQPGQQVPTQEDIAAYLERLGLVVVPRDQGQEAPKRGPVQTGFQAPREAVKEDTPESPDVPEDSPTGASE